MKAKNIFLTSALAIGSLFAQAQGLQGVVVERYYTANSADAADATAQGAVAPLVANQSTAFRVYIDLAPGYKFVQLFGRPADGAAAANPLTVSSTANFFNDPNFGIDLDAGNISSTNINKRTALIDSYFTTGLVSANKVGVREGDDTDGALTNQQGLLANAPACAGSGIAGASGKDGLMPSSGTTGVATNGLGLGTGNSVLSALAGITAGNSVSITDGAIAALGGIVGTTADNLVLIGQFTTSGNLVFSFNVQVVNIATGVAEVYVASNPRAGETANASLSQTISAGGCAPTVLNDNPATAIQNGYTGGLTNYPNCQTFASTLVDATNSSESTVGSGPDTWVKFVAQAGGAVSITMTSSSMDDLIELYSFNGATYTLMDSENVGSGNSDFERLNVSNLTPGTTYYISFGSANGAAGPFTYCIQYLLSGGCASVEPAGGFNLCSTFKASYRGASPAVTYAFNFQGTGGTSPTTNSTISNTNGTITLSNPTLGLRYGGQYDVGVSVTYNLTNSQGAPEVITATSAGGNCNDVDIANNAPLELVSTQRCTNGVTLNRTNYIRAVPIGTSTLCGVTNYTFVFQKMDDCITPSAVALDTIVATTSSVYCQLTALPNLPALPGTWSVKIRPNFSYGSGNFGPIQYITVNGTSSSSTEGSVSSDSDVSTNSLQSNIFPNPSVGSMVNLNLSGFSGNVAVRVLDATGRLIFSQTYIAEDNLNTVINFTSSLADGIYNVEFNAGGIVTSERLLVKN